MVQKNIDHKWSYVMTIFMLSGRYIHFLENVIKFYIK